MNTTGIKIIDRRMEGRSYQQKRSASIHQTQQTEHIKGVEWSGIDHGLVGSRPRNAKGATVKDAVPYYEETKKEKKTVPPQVTESGGLSRRKKKVTIGQPGLTGENNKTY